ASLSVASNSPNSTPPPALHLILPPAPPNLMLNGNGNHAAQSQSLQYTPPKGIGGRPLLNIEMEERKVQLDGLGPQPHTPHTTHTPHGGGATPHHRPNQASNSVTLIHMLTNSPRSMQLHAQQAQL